MGLWEGMAARADQGGVEDDIRRYARSLHVPQKARGCIGQLPTPCKAEPVDDDGYPNAKPLQDAKDEEPGEEEGCTAAECLSRAMGVRARASGRGLRRGVRRSQSG